MIEISTAIYANPINQQCTSPFLSAHHARAPVRDRNRLALQFRD